MKLETEDQYNTALVRVEQIFFAKPGTPEGDELDALANAIEAYEEEHYPMTTPEDDRKVHSTDNLPDEWAEAVKDAKHPDDPLIERLARAACEAEGRNPEELRSIAEETGRTADTIRMSMRYGPYWTAYQDEARRHLAMQRAYEREMAARHEAWTHECDHAWEIDVDGVTSTNASVVNTFRCKKCGTRQRYI